MVHYLQEMLRSRNFQVSINGNTSSLKSMETGLCQGSVLSVTMFLLAINTLTSYLPSTVECLRYADDVILIATGENAEQTEGKLQTAFDHLGSWETETGYKISAEKSATVIYRTPRKKKPTTPSKLTLNGAIVPRKNQHKCLGVILDQHLKYRAHAEEVKAACQQRVLFIRSIAARTWGGDRNTLLKLYRATILEKLLYAAPILSAMEGKVHQSLETVHNAGLRAIVGAFRTSPVVSLQAETGIPSLKTLINQRTVIYTSRCLAVDRIEENSENDNINHLSSDSNSDISSDERWGERARIQPNSYIDRGSNLIAELELQLPRTTVFKFPECPPWKRLKLNVDKSLHHELSQGSTLNDLRHIFNELRQTKYRIHKAIYTDGSKKDSKCGYGVVCDDFVFQKRMNNISSIFAAESEAIKQALTWIVDQRESRAYLICTDSMSVVTNLEKCKLNSRWKDSVQTLFNQIVEMGSEIVIFWVPSHIGIPGNERADIEAKKALELPEDENQIIDIKETRKIIKSQFINRWQMQWHSNLTNKLREVKNTVLPFKAALLGNRRDDVILARLRIGHTLLTHSYLLDRVDRPLCHRCNEVLTVKHIIAMCPQLEQERISHGVPGNLREALADDKERATTVLEYLKSIQLYDKI
ncbi:uncharacterized protein LOC129741577 [Uranotaenia lowii]|uniref:uncharacterized protein LOC129741577 n=1 Tax=Uranotaenia lowii TaxID=190385 RepID=UPI0024792AB7|nr:uncharacterized protein LOC129741577 [Uranotaenia lowii]